MKSLHYSFLAIIVILQCLLSACGPSAIETAQGYVPNEPPVITEFSLELALSGSTQKIGYWDDAVHPAPANVLLTGYNMSVTVRAEDPESNPLSFSFVVSGGATGSGSVITAADGLCDGVVSLNTVSQHDAAMLTVRVSDGRGSATSMTMNMGTGITGPQPQLISASATHINAAGSLAFAFRVPIDGYYQLVFLPANADGTEPATPAFDDEQPFYYYKSPGADKTITVGGAVYAGAAQLRMTGGSPDARYFAYVLFRNANKEEGSVAVPVVLDTVAPQLTPPARTGSHRAMRFAVTDPSPGADATLASGIDPATVTLDIPASTVLYRNDAAGIQRTATAALSGSEIVFTPSHYWVYGTTGTVKFSVRDRAGNVSTGTYTPAVYPEHLYIKAATEDFEPATYPRGIGDKPYLNQSAALQTALAQAQASLAGGERCTVWLDKDGSYAITDINHRPTFNGYVASGPKKSIALCGSGAWNSATRLWTRADNVRSMIEGKVSGAAGSLEVPDYLMIFTNVENISIEDVAISYTTSRWDDDGALYSAAVYCDNVSGVIHGIHVAGCDGFGSSAMGIFAKNSSLDVSRCIISAVSGSSSSLDWHAVRLRMTKDSPSRTVLLHSNVIIPRADLGSNGNKYGVSANIDGDCTVPHQVSIINNTFRWRVADNSVAELIALLNNSAVNTTFRLVNNLIDTQTWLSRSPVSPVYMKTLYPGSDLPNVFVLNNLEYDYDSPSGDDTFFTIARIPGSVSVSVSDPSPLGDRFAGNFEENPQLDGSGNLTGSSPESVMHGGLDMSALIPGATDHRGNPRTAGNGWSVGAFEW